MQFSTMAGTAVGMAVGAAAVCLATQDQRMMRKTVHKLAKGAEKTLAAGNAKGSPWQGSRTCFSCVYHRRLIKNVLFQEFPFYFLQLHLHFQQLIGNTLRTKRWHIRSAD